MTNPPDLSFLDHPDLLPAFVGENRPRATGAGLDPHEYTRVTAALPSLTAWPEACRAAGRRHLAAADRAAAQGHHRTAGEAYRTAARWFHFAGLLPDPDREAAALAATEADRAMRRALAHLDPSAERIEGASFAGWLRRPAGGGRSPVVVVVPGMDSGKEEFHAVAEALLARGTAVFAMDGPGQGVLAATSAPDPDYHRVVGRVIDAIAARDGVDAGRVGVIGLSLGGYYAAVTAAHEPRVRATAVVSGPYRLDWDALVPFVTATLTQRCGSPEAARAFARRVDLSALAPAVTGPLLVVEGGEDRIPGVTNAEPLAHHAPRAELLLVPHGNHLLGNALPDWLPATADWLTTHLAGGR
ncbi:alpha/beta fold hydrolase [Streptomyces sp. CB01881]|uniref:alpha/beta hydrolase family protein n=1 Tax=Streptomyces sp. CB01881 TaxID=2078691 RepID=UPI000CDC13D0|nr:alpha/beta fold hydrolase [Streptomyces sp. CB01881]AUY50518.1 alpha/beta hydrolase [Streptomyces sp. CB01881]TYC73906.1 alpha/beta fold hydrolase [Streptomyces sp. CB01881]